jgi:hypothetical protein
MYMIMCLWCVFTCFVLSPTSIGKVCCIFCKIQALTTVPDTGGWSEWNDVQVGSKIVEIDGKSLVPGDGKLAWKSEEKLHHAIGARPIELRILRNHPITLTFDSTNSVHVATGKSQTLGVVPEGKDPDPEGKVPNTQPDFQPGQPIVIGRTGDHPEHFQLGVVEPGSWAEAHLEPGDSILAIKTDFETGGRFRYLETDFETSAEVQAALRKNPVELKVRRKLAEHGRIWRATPKKNLEENVHYRNSERPNTSRPMPSSLTSLTNTLPGGAPGESPDVNTDSPAESPADSFRGAPAGGPPGGPADSAPPGGPPGIRSHLAIRILGSRSVEERLAEFQTEQSHIVSQAQQSHFVSKDKHFVGTISIHVKKASWTESVSSRLSFLGKKKSARDDHKKASDVRANRSLSFRDNKKASDVYSKKASDDSKKASDVSSKKAARDNKKAGRDNDNNNSGALLL